MRDYMKLRRLQERLRAMSREQIESLIASLRGEVAAAVDELTRRQEIDLE